MKKIKHINKVKRPVVRPCPCAAGHVSCSYTIISHIIGCPFDCTYCFLHTFYGKDEIVVYNNEDDIVRQVGDYLKQADGPQRLGTGQYSDSLAMPEAGSLAVKLVKFFARQKGHLFELKTKSGQVNDLLELDHQGRTVVAWSVNPEKIAAREELGAVSLAKRIDAARKCAAVGYPVGFHFDPIIEYPGWAKDYQGVVDLIFDSLEPSKVAWISLGALRYPPELKEIAEKRWPDSKITQGRMEMGEDSKLRYPKQVRVELFRQMNAFIRQRAQNTIVYLCMEEQAVWDSAGIENNVTNNLLSCFKFFIKR